VTARRIILGADAGGTKTVAWLAAAQPNREFEVLGRGSAGPGNPLRVGRETALANVAAAISSAGTDAGLQASDTTQAVVGMAGAGRAEVQQETSRWLQQHTAIKQIKVIPDFELVLPAAFPDREGIAVISGTGSIVHGVRGKQRTRIGGWGYLVDDHGSGYWFGRAALRAMARAADGRDAKTAISDLISARFNKTSVSEIIASLHDSPERLSQIASLAPVICEAAAAGDKAAVQITTDAAAALAEMIVTAAQQLGYARNEVPLAAAGGVLVGASALRERLLASLNDRSLRPVTFECVREPVVGAVRLASAI
jgi:N-acetylglucosamine kinase-like BadF-type ATPase